MKRFVKFGVLSVATFLVCASLATGLRAGAVAGAGGEDPWSPGDLMQPEDLAKLLSTQHKPVVLQVGIVHLYKISHIPGSKFAGPANDAAGLAELRKQAQGLNRNAEVVCYCGCCPWVNCPNTRPAYQALREMGFKKIRMLNLQHSFGEDWVSKGYPVEKGS